MMPAAPVSRREAARRKAFQSSALTRMFADDVTIILLSLEAPNSDEELAVVQQAALRCKAAVNGLQL